MEKYKNNLRVGGLAIIIGTRRPENRHLVGTTVTVEKILTNGGSFEEYVQEKFRHMQSDWNAKADSAIVSGVSVAPFGDIHLWIDNHSSFDIKHLMPIGDDDEWQKLFEQEDNPYLVEA